MKCDKEHIHYLGALWANLDIGKKGHEHKETVYDSPEYAAEAIRRFPLAPSIIVESGGGAHLYWLLQSVIKVLDPDRIDDILKNIAYSLKCDPGIKIESTLRLPDTVNTKMLGQPTNCEVKFIDTNFRYDLSDFKGLTSYYPALTLFGKHNDVETSEIDSDQSDDSLILDETLIDELIDDISMAGTVAETTPSPSEKYAAYESCDYDSTTEEDCLTFSEELGDDISFELDLEDLGIDQIIEDVPKSSHDKEKDRRGILQTNNEDDIMCKINQMGSIAPHPSTRVRRNALTVDCNHKTHSLLTENAALDTVGRCSISLKEDLGSQSNELIFYEGTNKLGHIKAPSIFATSGSDRSFDVQAIRSEGEVQIELHEPRIGFSISFSVARPKLEYVNCSVFAPTVVKSGSYFLVQVFIHTLAQIQEVESVATKRDSEASERGATGLTAPISQGTKLDFLLSIPGLDVTDDFQQTVWLGKHTSVQFGVSTPESLSLTAAFGTVNVIQAGIPIGKITFKIEIQADENKHSAPLDLVGDAKPYNLFFISYATPDRPEVIKRLQMLGRLGKKFYQDLLTLDPGDRWSLRLFELIDEADAMLLFWSSNAKKSEWVKKEWQYALEKKGLNYILPVIIEGPPPVDPPPELAELHMNDRLLYFS